MRHALSFATQWLNRVTAIVCGILLTVLVVTAVLQVIYRYVLLEPLIWSEEAARHLLVWITFLTGGLVISQNLNPRVEFLERLVSRRLRRALAVVIGLAIIGFLTFLAIVGYQVAVAYAGYRTLGTGLPQSWARLALPVGAVVMLINSVDRLAASMAGDDEVPTGSG